MLKVEPAVSFERPRDDDELARASASSVRFLDVPQRPYLMVDGEGDPNVSQDFQAAIQTLYPVAWTLRFALKARAVAAKVGPLEGLWWFDSEAPLDPARLAGVADASKAGWSWRLLIGLPSATQDSDVASAIARVRADKSPPALDRLRYERWTEGQSAQILHVGPYAAEAPTIERLHAAIAAAGLRPRGLHHEIYLGDPRRAAPDRLRTIIRQPVE